MRLERRPLVVVRSQYLQPRWVDHRDVFHIHLQRVLGHDENLFIKNVVLLNNKDRQIREIEVDK